MKVIQKEIKIYKFNEASQELKDKIIYNFSTIYDLYDHCMDERIETLKKLAEVLQGDLDYSLSCVPDRGEFITIKDGQRISETIRELIEGDNGYYDSCPLTGICYDDDLLEDLSKYDIQTALNRYIVSIHDEYESMLKEEYINDLCEANDYEFTENGKIYS